MSELYVTVRGHRLSIPQVLAIREVSQHFDEYEWHMNECGCCVSVHPKGNHYCGYIIDQLGEYEWVDHTAELN